MGEGGRGEKREGREEGGERRGRGEKREGREEGGMRITHMHTNGLA